MKIGKGLKRILDDKGISQKELAKKIGKSETSLSLIIQDKTQPRKDTLELISQALNVSTELLLVLSIEEDDIPDNKKEHYSILWPMIESSLLTLLKED